VMDRSQMVDVLSRLGKVEMNALIAPAAAGQFDAQIEQIVEAAKKLGFTRVMEVASGADEVAEHEAKEFRARMGRGEAFMTTSCCYAYTETVRKHIPELSRFVASTRTPLALTAERARADHKGSLNVFIGPCIAKKQEGMDNDDIDYVLTFEEFATMIEAYGIEPSFLEGQKAECEAGALGRGFPVTGGLYKAISYRCSDLLKEQTSRIETLDAKSLKLLKALPRLKSTPCRLMEVMSCKYGCIGGPAVVAEEPLARDRVARLVGRSSVK
jgi:iron only hydrogenase large subunit-like protein